MTRIQRAVAKVAVFGLLAALVVNGTALAQSTGPSAAASGTSGTSGQVFLNVGVDSDITSLNPYNLCCGPDYEYLRLVYDYGIAYDNSTLGPAPDLLTEWVPNSDSTEWTLTLRSGAKWSDGQPVTAQDVAFSYALVADNAIPFYKDYLPNSPTFSVIDDTHILWTSSKPTFAPIVPPAVPIVPEHVWSQYVTAGDAKATRKAVKGYDNADPIGSGVFKLAEYKQGQYIHLDLNPNSWEGAPTSITDVYFRIYDNPEAMATALESGEIDFAEGLKPELYNVLKGQKDIATQLGDGGCWGNIAWNFGGQDTFDGGPKPGTPTNDPAVQDVAFRQAMATSINRKEIATKVYQDTSTVGYSILMPGTNGSWVTDIPPELRFDYDPTTANDMLDAAGYLDTDNNGVRNEKGGGPDINLELLTITDVAGSVDTGKLIQGYFKAVGIDAFLTTVKTNKAYELWYTGEWDAYVWDWCPDPDPDFMLSVFVTDQCLGWSDGCWTNPEYDALYTRQQGEMDRTQRKATIDQMQLMIAEQLPTMVLNYWGDLQAYRTDRFDPSSWVKSPAVDNGLLLFGWTHDSYMNLRLIGSAAPPKAQGLSPWVWAAAAGAIVLIAVVVMLARRKGPGEEEA